MRNCLLLAAVLACFGSAALAQPIVTMDGATSRDELYAQYGNLSVQDTETGYGDANNGHPDVCNGSELDTVYGFVYDHAGTKWLYLLFAGNFETNGNKLNIFFDSIPMQGQNRLLYENPGPNPNDHVRRMSETAPAAGDGLTFGSGFDADYWLSVGCYGDPVTLYVDYAKLYNKPGDEGEYYYVGAGAAKCQTSAGLIDVGTTGNNPNGIRVTVDNSNVLGVPGGTSFDLSGAAGLVTTGIELTLPLSAIGEPTGNFTVCAFISNSSYSHLSNQFLGGLFGSENLGEPRTANLGLTAHMQFTVPVAPVSRGACCVGAVCTITTQVGCAGTYLGDNTDCVGNPCDSVPTGACYMYDDPPYTGSCDVMTPGDCATAGGVYQGDNTDCLFFVCTLPRTGACCKADYSCEILSEADCLLITGAWYLGDFSTCAGDPCFPGPSVTGTMNGWTLAQDTMTETAPGSGIWTRDYASFVAGERHEFKITFGNSWQGALPEDNAWLIADPVGAITITYDSNSYADGWEPAEDRIGLSHDPATWTAVGAWQGWNNADPTTAMVPQGGGIYLLERTFAPGTYVWKPVMTGTWDSIGTEGRSINGNNQQFVTDATNNTAKMWLDALTGVIKVEVVPGTGPIPGACCKADGTCAVITEADCLLFVGATWLGEGTNCRQCYTPVISGTMNAWDRVTDVMTETAVGSGIWEKVYTTLTANTRYEFKVAFGATDQGLDLPNSNCWTYTDLNGDVTIRWNSNWVADGWSPAVDRIYVSVDTGAWTAVGDFLSELGGSDWNNSDPQGVMAAQGGGIYLKQMTGLPAGTYNWKAVRTGSWDSISWNERSINTSNWEFVVTDPGETVKLWVDAFNGVGMVEILPPALQGACCDPSGACTLVEAVDCTFPSYYLGDGTVCDPNPCVPFDYALRVVGGVAIESYPEWYLYPNDWWNTWWPNEFALNRQKEVTLAFTIDFVGLPPVVAFNYSAPTWPDPLFPPLPADDAFVVRVPVDPPIVAPGAYTRTTLLPICPRWVSVDVQGMDFVIRGTIVHVCLPPVWCLGDMNCSGGSPTFDDIKYFSAAIGSESSWWAYYRAQNAGADPTCYWLLGDYNVPRNGVEFSDIKPFAASIGQPCIVYVP